MSGLGELSNWMLLAALPLLGIVILVLCARRARRQTRKAARRSKPHVASDAIRVVDKLVVDATPQPPPSRAPASVAEETLQPDESTDTAPATTPPQPDVATASQNEWDDDTQHRVLPFPRPVLATDLKSGASTVAQGGSPARQHDDMHEGQIHSPTAVEPILCLDAERGGPELCFDLGVRYLTGDGVRQNDFEAARWVGGAAEAGHSDAQYDLGVLFATGRGAPLDEAEAVHWFSLAAEPDNADARYNLQVMTGAA